MILVSYLCVFEKLSIEEFFQNFLRLLQIQAKSFQDFDNYVGNVEKFPVKFSEHVTHLFLVNLLMEPFLPNYMNTFFDQLKSQK